jgi:hypothetical protein
MAGQATDGRGAAIGVELPPRWDGLIRCWQAQSTVLSGAAPALPLTSLP